ncbi:MAG: IclR family transcriptional regulator [Ruminococcaceae bacterium]|nr:IclR family transcriptional regulator [Oscillospiraceae bacterium]
MSNSAPAVEACTKIITFLAECEQEIGISEISRGTGINKNMVFRILNTLENEGWVYCNAQKYSLTLLLFGLVSKPLSRLSLNTIASPVLYDLLNKTGESTYLGILKEDKVLYLQHFDGVKNVRVAGRVGGEYDLYCSAPGKVLLAHAEKSFIEEYTSKALEKRTKNSITEKSALLQELENVRKNGYATDCEEFGNGITCAAAPIYDYSGKVIATVGCSAFTTNGECMEMIEKFLPYVLSAAKKISLILGAK